MYKFVIKKFFLDLYNNLEKVMLMNLGFIVLLLPIIASFFLYSFHFILFLSSLLISCVFFTVYTGAVSMFVLEISDYNQPGFRDFWACVKKVWRIAVLFALAFIAVLVTAYINIKYYYTMHSFFGYAVMSVMIWVLVCIVIAMQYVFQVYGRFGGGFPSVIKKCFLLFLDNSIFSIFLSLFSLFFLAISVMTGIGMLFFGFTTVVLITAIGLKIRLYKYDYIEQNPDAAGSPVPWDKLLSKDRETIGKVTFKSLIFPWRK